MMGKCGFAIAAQKRAIKRSGEIDWFLHQAFALYAKDKKENNFKGLYPEWQTKKNLQRVVELFGSCPLYAKDLKKWNK